jgi:hypothetical protein
MKKFAAAIGEIEYEKDAEHLVRMTESIANHINSGSDVAMEVTVLISSKKMSGLGYKVLKEFLAIIDSMHLMSHIMIEGKKIHPEILMSALNADQVSINDKAVIEGKIKDAHPCIEENSDLYLAINNSKAKIKTSGKVAVQKIRSSGFFSKTKTIRSVPSVDHLFSQHISQGSSLACFQP